MMTSRILIGDVREQLATLPDQSVQTCVTSPPYYGLRDYGVSGQIGLEPTLAEFIATLVDVFRGVRRVLRDDGTLWVNMGDSYAGAGGVHTSGSYDGALGRKMSGVRRFSDASSGLKPKDLMMVPARLAVALQEPYTVPSCVPNEIHRAWLAAMFDGEGCIGIRRFSSYRKEVDQVYQDGFVVYTSMTNNDVPLIDRCIQLTGKGKVTIKQRADKTDGRGIVSRFDSHSWRLDGNSAVDVIRAIYPYLIAKRKQAILAYTLDRLNKTGKEVRGNGPMPPDEQAKRALLYDLIKRANQREHIDLPSWCEEPKEEVIPGWYLRSDIIWAKKAPMPESVTDRPTSAHEHIFLLTKQPRYFYDADAVREDAIKGAAGSTFTDGKTGVNGMGRVSQLPREESGGRNIRNVWHLGPEPFPEAHFATFPTEIPRRCIKAGTSERGCCPACGAPWVRCVDRGPESKQTTRGQQAWTAVTGQRDSRGGLPTREVVTTGWEPTCGHDAEPIPCTVLDPFLGSGTTLMVADQLGRHGIGVELNPEYAEMARRRITNDAPLFANIA